jgi:hypothetical protein
MNPPALLAHLKPGDYLVFMAGSLLSVFLAATLWQSAAADHATIRSGGKVFGVVPLSRDQTIDVPGPLGVSRIAIHDRQVRVMADPGLHQYCVRQGWLKRAGEIAICLPNQVSVELAGRGKNYDSLNY